MRQRLLAVLLAFTGAASAQPINIEAGHFEMLLAEHKAMYTGDVVATQGEREIRADNLTVYLNEDNDVVSMMAEGDPATLSDQAAEPPITLTGAALDYHFEEERGARLRRRHLVAGRRPTHRRDHHLRPGSRAR